MKWPQRLQCGECGRVVARLRQPPAWLESRSPTDPDLRYFVPIESASRDGHGGPPDSAPAARPRPTQMHVGERRAHPAGHPWGGKGSRAGKPDGEHVTYTLACHPKRCGQTYPVRDDSLWAAIKAGQGRAALVVGRGRYATEHGGADL